MLLPLFLFAASMSKFEPMNVLNWLYINDEAERADCDLQCPVGLCVITQGDPHRCGTMLNESWRHL